MIVNMAYSRLPKNGIWDWDALCWRSFFSILWGWRTVIFQLSGFYCNWEFPEIRGPDVDPLNGRARNTRRPTKGPPQIVETAS